MSKLRRKSPVWLHFSRLKDEEGYKAKCQLCQKVVAFTAGSISNLNRHLKSKHCKNLGVRPTNDVAEIDERLPDLSSEMLAKDEDPLNTQGKLHIRQEPMKLVRARTLAGSRLANPSSLQKQTRVVYLKPVAKRGIDGTIRAYLPNVFSDDGNVVNCAGNKDQVIYVQQDGTGFESSENAPEQNITFHDDVPTAPDHMDQEPVTVEPGVSYDKRGKMDSWLEGVKYKTDAKLQIAQEKLEVKKERYSRQQALAEEKERNRHEERMLKLEIIKMKLLQKAPKTLKTDDVLHLSVSEENSEKIEL